MKETDKIKMEINIAGERMTLTVPFRQQNAVRDTERRVTDLFQSCSARYPGKKPHEILAVVAYQLAYLYGELREQTDNALQVVDALDERLTNLLRDGNTPVADNDETEAMRTDFFTSY